MITKTQKQFLELLKAGLWGQKANQTLFDKTTDWKEIYIISKQQTVQGLIADGLGTLPKELHPAAIIEKRFIMEKLKIAQTHTLLNHVLNIVVKELNKHQIPHILLKGQGIAQNYNIPNSRVCGDIDLYVGMENFDKASKVILQLPNTHDGGLSDHDRHIDIEGVVLELHKKADTMVNPKVDAEFQYWTHTQLDKNFVTHKDLVQWNNQGTVINTPPNIFNAVFLLTHMLRHLFKEGVGLRQLCDWTIFINKYETNINRDELQKIIKLLDLQKPWNVFCELAEIYIGLELKELTYEKSLNLKKSEKILSLIFSTGNFGYINNIKSQFNEKNFLKYKYKRFLFHLSYNITLFPIFPKLMTRFTFDWIKLGIKSLF